MFGYITVDKEKISPKDYAYIKSFYCGLCITLKKRYGNIARVFNNYDMTLVFLLFTCFEQLQIKITKKHCIIHPFQKIAMLDLFDFEKDEKLSNEDKNVLLQLQKLANTIADATVLLVEGKIIDDIFDNKKGAKRKKNYFKKYFDKARNSLPDYSVIVLDCCSKIRELENSSDIDIEKLATYSGELTGGLAKCILNLDKNSALYQLLFELGKWIYYIDALCDLDEDILNNNFNPFIYKFSNWTNRQEFVKNNQNAIFSYLNGCLNNIKVLYEQLSGKETNTLIENVLIYGLKKQQDNIFISPKKILSI